MYCAHSCITRTQFFRVKSGEKNHVPIHNMRQIWTTDRGCTKLSILCSYYPSSPISITHRSIQHWHLINDELKRKRKLKRKEKKKRKKKKKKKRKKKKSFARHSPRCSFLSVSLWYYEKKIKKKNRLLGIRLGAVFFQYPFMVLMMRKKRRKKKKRKKKKTCLLGIRQGAVFFQYLFMVL